VLLQLLRCRFSYMFCAAGSLTTSALQVLLHVPCCRFSYNFRAAGSSTCSVL
ncbi:hypothetical protein NDU88_000245, partial [Pleurodeles waltl]